MTRRKQAGMSMIETMIAAGILGIGATAMVGLWTASSSGAAHVEGRTTAHMLAEQRLERLSGQATALPGCAGAVGCRQSRRAYQPALSPAGPFQCTQFATEEQIVDPTTATAPRKFRIDTVVQPHTDPVRYRDASIVTVSVCWTDVANQVQEVRLERMVVPEV
jgi:type II secretory pathway pseudopilin PulG